MAGKPKDLEERTAIFAEDVRAFVRDLPRTISNIEDVKQLVRASGSVAANCIEANEALGDRDRVMKFRTCRKEAKESQLWAAIAQYRRSRSTATDTGGIATGSARAETDFLVHREETRMIGTLGFIWRLAVWRLRFHP
jgi:four helix bundle protein